MTVKEPPIDVKKEFRAAILNSGGQIVQEFVSIILF
jgi:hypothetical protein